MLRNVVFNDAYTRIIDNKRNKEFYLENSKKLNVNRELIEIDNLNEKIYAHIIKPYPHAIDEKDVILLTKEITTEVNYTFSVISKNYIEEFNKSFKPEITDYFYIYEQDAQKNEIKINNVNPFVLPIAIVINSFDFKTALSDKSQGKDIYEYTLVDNIKYNNFADKRFYFDGSVLKTTITNVNDVTDAVELYVNVKNTTTKTFYNFRVFINL